MSNYLTQLEQKMVENVLFYLQRARSADVYSVFCFQIEWINATVVLLLTKALKYFPIGGLENESDCGKDPEEFWSQTEIVPEYCL